VADPIDAIAQAIVDARDPGAKLRIGLVTAIEAGGQRVRMNTTGDVWLQLDSDSPVVVGDRVYALVQGPAGVVAGKVTGSSAAVPTGALTMYAGSSTNLPTGWLICDGTAVSRTTYAALFAVIGTTYGTGNGSSTFNLPNLANRFPLGVGTRSRGATGGLEDVTLTVAQIPAHDHGAAGAHTHTVSTAATATNFPQGATGNTAAARIPDGTHNTGSSGSHTHASVGGNDPHENMPPFLTIYYLIKAV
jgi:microcystin-dependent protein